jgi:transcriptional regulator with GAF, ATPase, and Fis domain
MSRLSPTLLEAWREAGWPLGIAEALERVASLLGRRLPVDLVMVRWLDLGRRALETVASHACRPGPLPDAIRTELPAADLEALVDWCHEGRVLHRRAGAVEAKLPGALPPDLDGDVLLGPLHGEEGPLGLLVLLARRPRAFAASHLELVEGLLEPFAAALAHDRRLRAVETLREAAEADRRSLLSRLGRHDLGETIVGAEAGLAPVMERVGLVAASDVPVLILGETGSGKEVVARAIHLRSARAGGPFLRVNCGAIPSGLIDSELFGHERGSFTGATALRKGWFERADGGTLFLDEVGELPPAAQVRLLRILQDGSFERVGGQRTLHASVRVVAATHRDLQAMVDEGGFRQDLWYRIAVFPIDLPPLRERPEDIPALASHFALRAATRFGTPPRIPTPEDLELLVAYPWPGNVRELAAVLERAVILGDGQRLEVAKALGVAPAPPPRRGAGPPGALVPSDGDASFPTLDEAMARHIEAALERAHGKIEGRGGAAALLGINPHTLRARMRKLGIAWQRFRGA